MVINASDYFALVDKLSEFENQPVVHMLQLIAGDLDDPNHQQGIILRARAGWLRRFSKTLPRK